MKHHTKTTALLPACRASYPPGLAYLPQWRCHLEHLSKCLGTPAMLRSEQSWRGWLARLPRASWQAFDERC